MGLGDKEAVDLKLFCQTENRKKENTQQRLPSLRSQQNFKNSTRPVIKHF